MKKNLIFCFIFIFQFSLFSLHALEKSLFVTLGPKIMLNTDDATKSAPSPVMYSMGAGGDFLLENNVLLQAHVSLFTNYYLWDGERARPAEVENRTATALSAMLDLTGGYLWTLGENKKHLISLSGGLGFLLRYGILSNGVNSDEVNSRTGTKIGDDVSEINSSFYKELGFLYPEITFSYSYKFSETWKIGGDFRNYLPLGAIINSRGCDGMIFSIMLKLSKKL